MPRVTSSVCTKVLPLLVLMGGCLFLSFGAYAQSELPEGLTFTHENLLPPGEPFVPAPLKRGGTMYPVSDPGAYLNAKTGRPEVSFDAALSGAASAADVRIARRFPGPNFEDVAFETGFLFIPPDPIGAAGRNLVVAVVNSVIEARNKSGSLLWREGLTEFFASLNPGFLPFDPKIVYDPYEDRFVVVALDYTDVFFGDPENASKLLLAVSRTSNPQSSTADDWYFHAIDAAFFDDNFFLPGTFEYWADYPGFEVDEEAIYITANTFSFVTDVPDVGLVQVFGGPRLWIVDKGVSGGFYGGGSAEVDFYDPFEPFPLHREFGLHLVTTMPAQVHGDGGIGPGIGTFLVAYEGLSLGGPLATEFVQVISIYDPLGSAGGPFFQHSLIPVGDIEDVGGSFGFPALPDAPQDGTNIPIEVNDRRALDAVWRDGSLWFTTTILPGDGPDANETTAHWFKIDTRAAPLGALTLADQGDIGGNDIEPGTYTYYPSVAANRDGYIGFGFSASAPNIFPGAYATARHADDPPGSVYPSATLRRGQDYYVRTFGLGSNRWGDYTGISVDPANDRFFWVFNQYAGERGLVLQDFPDEDGRWETAWGRMRVRENESGRVVADAFEAMPSSLTSLPTEYALEQNYPNPFNPSTEITFALPEGSATKLVVYDVAGREVARLIDEHLPAGRHAVSWQAQSVPSGVYVYRLTSGPFTQTKHMVVLK